MTQTRNYSERLTSELRDGTVSLAVWGCGHIGASAMYYFSRAGIRCVGYDIAESRVREIADGRFLSTDVVPSGRLEAQSVPVWATTDWRELRNHQPVVHIIAVPTERGAEPSSAALEDIMPSICETIRATDTGGLKPVLIVESTIQPTWIDTVILPKLHASGLRPGRDILVGAAPRRDWFSGGGYSLETLPRVVGGTTAEATEVLIDLYGIVCREIVPARDAYHAAFTKVIENLLRFQGLTLANTLSLAFPDYDMTHVLSLASTKWNIPLYHPSMGVGGHCIPLAPQYALAEGGDDNTYLDPIRSAVAFNEAYFAHLYRVRLVDLLRDCRSIAILGLAYTPDAKMHKLSPALDALETLKDTPRLRVHDPYYSPEEIEDICGVTTLPFPEGLADCDGVILVTAHTAYRDAPVEECLRPGTVVIDNFGAWRDRNFHEGVRYYEVGRPHNEDSRRILQSSEPASTNVR